MAKHEQDIPTLTQVVSAGDDSMLNHFDAKQLKKTDKDIQATPVNVENASETENLIFSETPSTAAEHIATTRLPTDTSPDITQYGKEEIKEKIQQAIKEAMPGIEAQLMKHLYKKFGV